LSLEGELSSRYAEARRNLWGAPPLPKPIHLAIHAASEKAIEQKIEQAEPVKKKRHGGPRRVRTLPKTNRFHDVETFGQEVFPNWREVVKQTLIDNHETLARLRSNNRDYKIVEVRRKVAYQLRMRGWSYPRIGEFLNRDHTSVLSLLKKEGWLDEQSRLDVIADNSGATDGSDGQSDAERVNGD